MSKINDIVLKYFVLPLYNVSYKQVEKDYKNMYLKREGSHMFLELSQTKDFSSNPYFTGMCVIGNKELHIFETPLTATRDIQEIIQSKYSKISSYGKDKIVQLSGLKYRVVENSVALTSWPLMALFKFVERKEKLERDLGIRLLDTDELMSSIDSSIFIENVLEEV